jgi:peptidoglycan/xylan/chitin deacetylase (PgdA/CDA1 family)
MSTRHSLRTAAIRFTLDALFFSGAFQLLRGRCQGTGIVLTLHHVRPAVTDAFQPSQSLAITPEFLEEAIVALRRLDLEFISLDEMHSRLCTGKFRNRFACITFDDGYRDISKWAYPVLRHHRVPFAVFVVSDFADRRGHLWWRTLEQAVSSNDHVTIGLGGKRRTIACGTPAAKLAAIRAIHQALSELPTEAALRAVVDEFAAQMNIDTAAQCEAACMSWDELASLASDSLVTIGAHTVTHPRLRKLPAADAWREMEASVARIESMLRVRPQHFAYPFGDVTAAGSREFAYAEELRIKTAVTTRPGVIFRDHHKHLTSLPRISLNGDYQRLRYLRVLESGAATAIENRCRRIDAVSTRQPIDTLSR